MNKAKSLENHLKNLIIGEEVEGDDKYVKSYESITIISSAKLTDLIAASI